LTSTYNPIIEARQRSRFWPITRQLRPTINTALVLRSDNAPPQVVWPAAPRPGRQVGKYRDLYIVDTAEHVLRLECHLPCNDGAFLFATVLTYACQVADPLLVVRHGRKDAGAVLTPLLTSIMRTTSCIFGADESSKAERAINEELSNVSLDLGFAIRNCVAELQLDADEARNVRGLRNVRKKVGIEQVEIDYLMPLIESGNVGLLALYIGEHREHAGAIIKLLLDRDQTRGDQLIEVLRVTMSADDEHDFDIEAFRSRIAERAVDELSGGATDGEGATASSSARHPLFSASLLGRSYGKGKRADDAKPVKVVSATPTEAKDVGAPADGPNGAAPRDPDFER
jgi:hypothetical protein